MAEEVQIRGTSEVGKIRNPLGVVALGFVTLGIYVLVWYYKINKELAEMGRANNTEELGTSPGTSLMAVLFGWIIIVPPFISIYNTWKRVNAAERLTGQQGMEAGLGLLLWIFISPVAEYILQANLNKVLQAQAAGQQAQVPSGQAPLPTGDPQQAAAVPPPPPPPPPAQS